MSNPTTPFSWQMPTATDLVTDLPADFEVFGQAVATDLADLLGGPSGYILSKNSATDMDFVWVAPTTADVTGVTAGTGITVTDPTGPVPTVTNAMATTITTNGDLIYGTGSGTFTRRGIGSTDQVLTVAGGIPTWATSAGFTLLSTTTLSGTSTSIGVTATGYRNLVAYIYGVNVASGNFNCNVRINGITAATYTNFNSSCVPAGTITNTGGDTSAIDLNQPGTVSVTSGGLNAWNLTFWDCNSTQKKNVTVNGSYINMNAVNNIMENRVSVTAATSAINNITVISGTAITAGTIEIYGVK